jgi:hypothetical protein
MKRITLLSVIAVVAFVTLACGISFNLPVDEIVTGPTTVDEILIPFPEEDAPAEVTLAFGAGELDLSAGAENALIEGTAKYNIPDFAPEIDINDTEIRLATGNLELTGIPRLSIDDLENEWDLQLSDYPMDLIINAGAYQGDFDLGDLSLNSLEISDGAAEVRLDFSEPNKVDMSRFRYSTGASSVKMTNLANANFSLMTFRSGAGDYTLDFSGELQRDANVVIESGISKITIIVPEGMAAEISLKGGLTNVDADGDWDRSGSTYSLPGTGYKLTIQVELGAGNLELRTY